uniref:Uncharacterized protein n=1 Tax=Anguilla anguilla TaxID=7936 RepID=A0A0E9SBM5_ANGAN
MKKSDGQSQVVLLNPGHFVCFFLLTLLN